MLELLEIFINNILPILLIASVGFAIGRIRKIPPEPLSEVIFYISSPALVFYSLYAGDVGGDEFALLFIAMVTFQLTAAGLALFATQIQGITGIQRASVINGSFCINGGNFGLSLVFFAFDDAILSRAVVIMVSAVLLHYSLGVYVASSGRGSIKKSLINVAKTPAIYAIFLAFFLRSTGLELPVTIDRSVSLLKDMALPLMLLMLGLQLGKTVKPAPLRSVITGTTIKLLLAPFLATGIGMLLNLPQDAFIAFVIMASMPTAVMTIILATQFESDRNLALNIIMATTFTSPITLSILIFLMQRQFAI